MCIHAYTSHSLMYACITVCTHGCMNVCDHWCMRAFLNVCIHVCMIARTTGCVHTRKYIYILECIRVYAMRAHACVCACMNLCVCARAYVCTLFMRTCLNASVHVCARKWLRAFTYYYMQTRRHACMCMRAPMHARMYAYARVRNWVWMHVCAFVSVYMHVRMRLPMDAFMCVHTCAHAHVHIHVYTHNLRHLTYTWVCDRSWSRGCIQAWRCI